MNNVQIRIAMQANALQVMICRCSVLKVQTPSTTVGVNYDEVPPVPIPNTEVKLICADDTWTATSRENRSSPTTNARTEVITSVLVC